MPNTCQQDPTVEYKTDIEEPMSSRALLRPRVLTRDPPSDPPGTPSNISPKKQIPGHHRREQRVAFEKNSVKELMYRVILFFPYVAIMIMCKVLVSNITEHETSVVSLHGATQERAEATTMTAPTGSRPWMVVHVGPPKTATTTIKKGLLEVAEKLALDDNVYFVGGIQSSRVDVNVGVDTEFKVYRNADTFPSNHESAMQSNFEEFSQALEGHLRNGHNVVISNDMYTHADGLDWDKLFEGIFLKKNQTTSANDGFRVKVVVGYDHLFRWLPSMYYRDYLKYPYLFADPDGNPREYANAYIPGLIEFIESSLDSVVQYDHNVVEASSEVSNPSATVTRNNDNPLYAQVKGTRFKQFKQVLNGIHGSVWAYLKFMTRPELSDAVDVFDVLHQEVVSAESILDTVGHKKSVVTNFVCQALPSADKTCMHLLMQDNTNTNTNTETRNFPEMQAETFRTSKADRRITFPDMHRITQHARVVFRNTKTSLELYQSGRPEWDLYNAIDEWFHDPLNPNRAQTFKVCMDSNLAAKYKSVSWKFLVQMALLTKYRHTLNGNTTANDSLFASSMPRDRSIFFQHEAAKDDTIEQDDLLWLAQTKEEHDRAFDEYVGGGTYDNTIKMCQLDVVALFEDKEFVEYFSNIQQRPARHKTKHIKKVAKKSGTLKDEKLSKRTKNGTSMFIS